MDNNSIDFGKIYGISGDCAGGPCEFTGNVVPNTPSLEQIASYNVRLRAGKTQENPEIQRKLSTLEEGYQQGVMQDIPKKSHKLPLQPQHRPAQQGSREQQAQSAQPGEQEQCRRHLRSLPR